MNLLLLIYAMIAGLTGFNAGPSAIAQAAAVAETGSLVPAHVQDQVSIAAKAMVSRAVRPGVVPTAAMPDARRIAIGLPVRPKVVSGRAAPERRLE